MDTGFTQVTSARARMPDSVMSKRSRAHRRDRAWSAGFSWVRRLVAVDAQQQFRRSALQPAISTPTSTHVHPKMASSSAMRVSSRQAAISKRHRPP
jgi:hypothetical protein